MNASQHELDVRKRNDRIAIIAIFRALGGLALTWCVIVLARGLWLFPIHLNDHRAYGFLALLTMLLWAPIWVVLHVWIARFSEGNKRFKMLRAILVPSFTVGLLTSVLLGAFMNWWDKML